MNGRVIRRSVAWPVTVAVLLSALAIGLYSSSMLRLKRLQPTYPYRITLTVATPPGPFAQAHILFPVVLVLSGCGVVVAVLNRARARQPREGINTSLLVAHAVLMIASIII